MSSIIESHSGDNDDDDDGPSGRGPASSPLQQSGHQGPCPSFFLGGAAGLILFADDLGHCSEVVHVRSPVKTLYYSFSKDYLILLTADAVLYKYVISPDGQMTQDRKVL